MSGEEAPQKRFDLLQEDQGLQYTDYPAEERHRGKNHGQEPPPLQDDVDEDTSLDRRLVNVVLKDYG